MYLLTTTKSGRAGWEHAMTALRDFQWFCEGSQVRNVPYDQRRYYST